MLPASLKSLKNLFGGFISHTPIISVTSSAGGSTGSQKSSVSAKFSITARTSDAGDVCDSLLPSHGTAEVPLRVIYIKPLGCWEVSCGAGCMGTSQVRTCVLWAILQETALPGMSAAAGHCTGRARLPLGLRCPIQWKGRQHHPPAVGIPRTPSAACGDNTCQRRQESNLDTSLSLPHLMTGPRAHDW